MAVAVGPAIAQIAQQQLLGRRRRQSAEGLQAHGRPAAAEELCEQDALPCHSAQARRTRNKSTMSSERMKLRKKENSLSLI